MSTRSRSESSGLGVPPTPDMRWRSGARTEMEASLPWRFSFPPTRLGRGALPCVLPVETLSSGVSEFLRLDVEARGRFWPAVDLRAGADLRVGALAF